MSYKIVKITSYYRDFLKQYYTANPQIGFLTYQQQYEQLMNQAYGWADFFEKNLRMLGVEAYEIVANADMLQQTWARENGVVNSGKEVVFEQIKKLKPDVVFFQDSFVFNGEWITRLREAVPSIKLAIGWCCTNYSKEHVEVFRVFDFFLVCSRMYVEAFSAHGLRTYELHHAFEPSLLSKIQQSNQYPESQLIFLGSLVPGKRGHNLRRDVLVKLLDSGLSFDMYAHILTIPPVDLLLRRSAYIVAKSLAGIGLSRIAKSFPLVRKAYYLEELPGNSKHVEMLGIHAKPSLYGIEMYKALSKAKMGFNCHGEGSGEYAANVRLFEVTGVGSCLVTDWKKNLNELFQIDSEIVVFTSADECIEKVQWLINHPKERAEIARRGQERVLRDHTYSLRAEQLNSLILQNLK